MVKQDHPFGIDTLLLLVLVTGHMWFNPINNVFMVLGVAAYVLLDLVFPEKEETAVSPTRRQRILFMVRLSIVFYVLLTAVLLFTGFNILQRRADGPVTHVHDGLIQTEIAIEYLLAGKNPYVEDYVDTPMADFAGTPDFTGWETLNNVAPLYHNAYLPFLFVGSIPFYLVSQTLLGWYDQRFVYLLAYLIIILLLPALVEHSRDKLALLIAVGLNFLFVYFLAEGRNDILILLWLVLATILVSRGRVEASAAVIGLALATKHQAWFFLPFYFLYLLPHPYEWKTLKRIILRTWPMAVVAAILLLPFLLWDASAFIQDTLLYISGSGPDSFPINGWGISALFLWLGIIPHPEAAFPFGLFELVFGLPVLFLMLRRQWQENTITNIWLGYAVFSFTFQFFSRFFHDSYFVFILQLLVIAYFIKPVAFPHKPLLQENA
jgi:hypothetical protein